MDTVALRGTSLELLQNALDTVQLERVLDGSGQAGRGHNAGWVNRFSNTRLFLRDQNKRTNAILIDDLDLFPALENAIECLRWDTGHELVTSVMLNELHAGGRLSPHRDGLPDDDRYHLALHTNPHALWWDEINGYRYMPAGEWTGPVPYCGVLHSVINNGNTKRVHVVVDFAKPNGSYV